jgi:hypothetical protein
MTLNDGRGSRLIFLSHSGRDEDLANRLSSDIRTEFALRGPMVNVFNTSDPQYRFTEWENKWEKLPRAIDDWRVAAEQEKEKLRAYLSTNLAASSAYLLLVTDHAIFGGSDWVPWEIQEGTALALEHHVPFVPVLVGVSYDDMLATLPREAVEFQGIKLDINKPEELRMELRKLINGFLARSEWRRAFEEGPGSKQA